MTPGESVQAAYEAKVGAVGPLPPLPSLTPMTDLIRSLGGSTAAAARQLGVSQRTVERRRVAEGQAPKGGTQGRGVRAVAAAKAQHEARRQQLDKAGPIREFGFSAYFRISDSSVYRARNWELTPEEQSALRDALLREDWDAAADVVFDAYADGSGLEVDEVEELSF